jgi:hypothetical protein
MRQEWMQSLGILWSGVLAAPVAFLLNLEINYALVPWACATGKTFTIHIASAATLILACVGWWLAWQSWRSFNLAWPDGAQGVAPRARFLAAWGFLMSALFALVIIAQIIPTFMLGPCQR